LTTWPLTWITNLKFVGVFENKSTLK